MAEACGAEQAYAYDTYFSGLYDYLTAAGSTGTPLTTESCTLGAANRVVKIIPRKNQAADTFGYTVTADDEFSGNSNWAIDIPQMRVDPGMVNGGEKVWIRVCLSRFCEGDCVEECCAYVSIGTLCCLPPSVALMGPLMLLLSD